MSDRTRAGKVLQPRDSEMARRRREVDVMRLQLAVADNEVIILEREQDIATRRKNIEATQAKIKELEQEDTNG